MIRLTLIFTFIFTLFTGPFCYSQNNKLLFKHLTIEQGLSESTVHAIYQDSYGYMWFGTDAGLDKFDGYDFTNYQHVPTDTTTLSANFVVAICEDRYGTFWVGSGYQGLNILDRETGDFRRIEYNPNNPNSISSNDIRDIIEDSKGNVWIATAGGGLNLYNREANNFLVFKKKEGAVNTLGSNFIASIAEDSKGILWLGSTEGIVTKFNPNDSIFTILDFRENYQGDLYNSTFGQIYVDSDDNIWYCTEVGLIFYNQKTNESKVYNEGDDERSLSSQSVSDIFEYQDGIFLISTDHGGLNILNTNTGIITKQYHNKFDETSVSSNQLYTIYQSSDGIIWIGGFRGGINYYDKSAYKFDQLKYLLHGEARINCCGSVLGITEDLDGNIWLAFDGEGLKVFSHEDGIIREFGPSSEKPSIETSITTCLFSDVGGDIWIGTYLNGMYRYDWKNKSFEHFKNNPADSTSLNGNNVWTIIEQNDETLWLGTMGEGVGLFDKRGHLLKQLKHDPENTNSLNNNDVFILLQDHSENLWIGTRKGLDKYIPSSDSIVRYSGENGPYGLWITNIFLDSKGNIWVGSDVGLSLYQPEQDNFMHFTSKEGIPGKQFFNILEDNNANLWISSNQGLSRFDPETRTFRTYDISDGLQSSTFNYTTAFADSKGRFYFGGTGGFNVFYPDSIVDNHNKPKVFISELQVLNEVILPKQDNAILSRDISLTESIVLSHKQSVFSLKYAALNYTNTSKNRYKYKLEGFDSEWISVGNKREVSYTNLNPGNYSFMVMASNNDGVWNEVPAVLKIEILPPIYKTKWFIALVIFTLIVFIFHIYYWRLKRLQHEKVILTHKVKERTVQIETQNKELEEHRSHLERQVSVRTDELLKAKEKAEESDRLKSTFLANMSHEIRTPMNAIVGFSNLLADASIGQEEREEYIKLIGANSDTLLRLIEDILDLSLIEADQLVLRDTVFSLNEVVDNVFSTIALSYENASFAIENINQLQKNDLTLKTDKFRLSQILFNLLNNACKFTNEGSVKLLIEKHNKQLVFSICDTGIGIPKEDQEKIFVRFSRHESKETDYRGIGLGLAISKRLTHLLGGELTLQSDVGKGSTFSVSFPLQHIVSEERTQKNEVESVVNPNWKGKSLLIVEDEEMNYLFLKRVLEKTNATISWAENGKLAVDLFEQGKRFDLVLMDIRMPVMDGYDAKTKISHIASQQVIIAQTAHARPEEEQKIMAAGFDGYITKPIVIKNLIHLMAQHLS